MGASPVRKYRRRGSAFDDDNLMFIDKAKGLLRVSLVIIRHFIIFVLEFVMTFCIVESER